MELLLAVIITLAQAGAAGSVSGAAPLQGAGETSPAHPCEPFGAGEVEPECAGASQVQFMALQQP